MLGDGITTCLICGAPLDRDGNCTAIGGPVHGELQSEYCPQCPNKLPCAEHGTTEHVL